MGCIGHRDCGNERGGSRARGLRRHRRRRRHLRRDAASRGRSLGSAQRARRARRLRRSDVREQLAHRSRRPPVLAESQRRAQRRVDARAPVVPLVAAAARLAAAVSAADLRARPQTHERADARARRQRCAERGRPAISTAPSPTFRAANCSTPAARSSSRPRFPPTVSPAAPSGTTCHCAARGA